MIEQVVDVVVGFLFALLMFCCGVILPRTTLIFLIILQVRIVSLWDDTYLTFILTGGYLGIMFRDFRETFFIDKVANTLLKLEKCMKGCEEKR